MDSLQSLNHAWCGSKKSLKDIIAKFLLFITGRGGGAWENRANTFTISSLIIFSFFDLLMLMQDLHFYFLKILQEILPFILIYAPFRSIEIEF